MTERGNRTFVLVHGARHGGWRWRRVVPLLRSGTRLLNDEVSPCHHVICRPPDRGH